MLLAPDRARRSVRAGGQHLSGAAPCTARRRRLKRSPRRAFVACTRRTCLRRCSGCWSVILVTAPRRGRALLAPRADAGRTGVEGARRRWPCPPLSRTGRRVAASWEGPGEADRGRAAGEAKPWRSGPSAAGCTGQVKISTMSTPPAHPRAAQGPPCAVIHGPSDRRRRPSTDPARARRSRTRVPSVRVAGTTAPAPDRERGARP